MIQHRTQSFVIIVIQINTHVKDSIPVLKMVMMTSIQTMMGKIHQKDIDTVAFKIIFHNLKTMTQRAIR